jgi:anti-sigma regulatory factor (Ser/Thr protein kinase)
LASRPKRLDFIMLYDRPIGENFSLEFPPLHSEASRARRRAIDELRGRGLSSELMADLELILAELTSNAVDREPSDDVRMDITISESAISVAVANRCQAGVAPSFPVGGRDNVDPLSERGRGLAIVEALADDLMADHSDGWTTLSCVVPIA